MKRNHLSLRKLAWRVVKPQGDIISKAQEFLKDIKAVSANKTKEYTTVLLEGTMTNYNSPALPILGDKGAKRLKVDVPDNLYLYHRPGDSWMDRTVMKWYIRNVVDCWTHHLPEGKRTLLLLDNHKGHADDEIKKEFLDWNFDLKLFLSNTISILQPMDLTVNSPFKS